MILMTKKMRIIVASVLVLLLIAYGGGWSMLCPPCAMSSAAIACHAPAVTDQEAALVPPCCCALTCAEGEEQVPALPAAELLPELQIEPAQFSIQYRPHELLPRCSAIPIQPEKAQSLFRLHCSFLI